MATNPFGVMIDTATSLGNIQTQRAQSQLLQDVQAAKQQEAERAAAMQQQFTADIQAAYQAPDTIQALGKVMTMYPEMADNIKKGVDVYQGADRQRNLQSLAQVAVAMEAGDMGAARSAIEQNMPLFMTMPEQVRKNPQLFQRAVTTQIAALGKEGQDLLTSMGWTPKAQLEQKEFGLKKTKEEFDQWAKRQDIDIARLNAQISRESNDIKRQELIANRDAKMQERQQASAERQSDFESKISDIDSALMTITDIKTDDNLGGWFGATGTTGVVTRNIPGTGAYDVAQKIKTLQSQSFLASVEKMKGLGQLTEAEGQRLVNSVGALEPGMSEKAFRSEMAKVENTLKIARSRMQKKYGQELPMTGSFTVNGKSYSPAQLIEESRKLGITVEEAKKALGIQ
jgi:hypothetical protein